MISSHVFFTDNLSQKTNVYRINKNKAYINGVYSELQLNTLICKIKVVENDINTLNIL